MARTGDEGMPVNIDDYIDTDGHLKEMTHLQALGLAPTFLGAPLERNAKLEALKKAYHAIIRRYHPDKLTTVYSGRYTTAEITVFANLISQRINEAYRSLKEPLEAFVDPAIPLSTEEAARRARAVRASEAEKDERERQLARDSNPAVVITCRTLSSQYSTREQIYRQFGSHVEEPFKKALRDGTSTSEEYSFDINPKTNGICIKVFHFKYGNLFSSDIPTDVIQAALHPKAVVPEFRDERAGMAGSGGETPFESAKRIIRATGMVYPKTLSATEAYALAKSNDSAILRESTTAHGQIAISLPNGQKFLLDEQITLDPTKFLTEETIIQQIKTIYGFSPYKPPVATPMADYKRPPPASKVIRDERELKK